MHGHGIDQEAEPSANVVKSRSAESCCSEDSISGQTRTLVSTAFTHLPAFHQMERPITVGQIHLLSQYHLRARP